MRALQIKTLELIKENKTIEEITKTLNISNKKLIQILNSLKNNGYDNIKKYYDNGDIVVSQMTYENFLATGNTSVTINKTGGKNQRYLVISDNHLGSKLDRVDLLDKVFLYAIDNNIHSVLNLGDFIDGYHFDTKYSRNKNIENQVKYALKKYPHADKITTFLLLGNHDLKPFINDNYNILNVINNERLDIVPLGYGEANINTLNETIKLYHKLPTDNRIYSDIAINKLNLFGHQHKYDSSFFDDKLSIFVPSISNIRINKNMLEAGMLDLKLSFYNEQLAYAEIKHILLEPNIITASKTTYHYQKKYTK